MSNRRPKSSATVSFNLALVYCHETGEVLGTPTKHLYDQAKKAANGVVSAYSETTHATLVLRGEPSKVWQGYQSEDLAKGDAEARKVFVG